VKLFINSGSDRIPRRIGATYLFIISKQWSGVMTNPRGFDMGDAAVYDFTLLAGQGFSPCEDSK
jgi:hypothetical protein